MSELIKNITDDLKYNLARIQKKKNEFLERFTKNPTHTLYWSNEMFELCCEADLINEILEMLEKNAELSLINKKLENSALNGARNPHFSTSPTANLIEIYKASMSAKYAEEFKSYLK